jgi:uncharacterized protein YndB with AHSA1/START domain
VNRPTSTANNAHADDAAGDADAFSITCVFDAPRELVYQAWTEAERLQQWWAPVGFKLSVLTLDVRPGGIFHYGMRLPDGHEMWGKFTYRAIVPPERIDSILSFANRDGNPVRHPMSPTWPLETRNTMTLKDESGKTRLTLRSTPYRASALECETFRAGHDSMTLGLGATFSQLAAYLARA